MAYVLSDLVAYIEENKGDLMTKAILGSTAWDHVTIIDGVKSEIKVPDLESTVPFQAGAGCNTVTSSGSTTISQTPLATSPIEFAEKICLNSLEDYYTQKYLPKGANVDSVSIFSDILNRKIAQIALQVEQAMFQGNTAYTNSTVLKQINGFIKRADDASDEVTATAQASVTTSTIRTIVNEIIFQKIPNAAYQNSPSLLMGMENFRILLQKLWEDNAFNYFPGAADLDKHMITYPGTNVKIYGIAGLNNDTPVDTGSLNTTVKNRMICTYKENLLVGTDLQADMKSLESWYEKKDRSIYIYGRMRLGTAIRYTDHVVTYANS